MPVSFLTEEQARRYGRYAGEPSPEQLARHFHLDDADRAFLGRHRGEHMRLGCAVQLGTVRFLGTFLDDPSDAPASVVRCMADQLGFRADGHMAAYRASTWRWRHPVEIRQAYGYRSLEEPGVGFHLARWLYGLCWIGTDRPSTLFDRATAWLVGRKVLLPGVTTLERLVARVRARVAERLWRELTRGLVPEQQAQLEALLIVREGERQSPLDRLRQGPVLRSGRELARAVRRLAEIQELVQGLPGTGRLPRSRVLSLARFAAAAKAQTISRMPKTRRIATLLAFVRTLEASAGDDVLDLFDVVVSKLLADAAKAEQQARLRSLRDLDQAALVLRLPVRRCSTLLSPATPCARWHSPRFRQKRSGARWSAWTAWSGPRTNRASTPSSPPIAVCRASCRRSRARCACRPTRAAARCWLPSPGCAMPTPRACAENRRRASSCPGAGWRR